MPADRIRIGEVVRHTEGESLVVECFEHKGGDCCLAPACRLRGVLADAVHAFYSVLDRYTLADVVKNRDELANILFIPRRAA
jgi:Rrf2 family nitric oxide-sensitive transcriptional repressor